MWNIISHIKLVSSKAVENRFGAPASGTPEERSARREFELLLLLGGSRKAAVQLWKWERRQRIYANAQQAAGRPATEAKGSRGAAERQAGGESKPETAAQAARRHRSEHRLREKHLARKIWAAVRVRKHLSRWCERARAAVAKRPAPSSTDLRHQQRRLPRHQHRRHLLLRRTRRRPERRRPPAPLQLPPQRLTSS